MEGIGYRLIRSCRKTIAIEITGSGILVRAPKDMHTGAIDDFLKGKRDWIQKQLKKLEKYAQYPKFTAEEMEELFHRAKETLPQRVAHFAKILNVSYSRITIRAQHTRWGSCSSKGNLSFNCLLLEMPPEVVDYVIVHELCHRKEMNHSGRFWEQVEGILPDYRHSRKWLREMGTSLIARLPEPNIIAHK